MTTSTYATGPTEARGRDCELPVSRHLTLMDQARLRARSATAAAPSVASTVTGTIRELGETLDSAMRSADWAQVADARVLIEALLERVELRQIR